MKKILSISILAFLIGLMFANWGAGAKSYKSWTDISEAESIIKLENWPISSDASCRFRIRTSANYSGNTTVVFCPRYTALDEPKTYIRLRDVNPGYYVTGRGGDFSEHPMFTKWKGSGPSYWQKAVIKPGQRTTCNDSDCGFRRIEFSVKGKDCQWIFHAPNYIPNAGLQDSPQDIKYSVEIFTCQTGIPFTEEHIEMKPGSVTVTFPGVGNTESASEADSDAANNKTRLEQKCLYGDTNACKLLNSLTSKPKATENDCPDGSIDNGKGECLVHRKEANTADGSNPPTKNVETQTAMKPVPSSGSTTEKRSIAVQWEGKDSLLAGHITIPKSGAGNITFSVPETGGKCSGTFVYTNPKKGIWSAACTTGETASGSFKALGAGRGSTGTGKDNEGRTVRFTIGAK